MRLCTYCNVDIPKGSGMLYVFKSGKTANFCSKKCEKHQIQLKRKSREMKWVTSKKN
jgi:ribosomal protein L24E